LLLPWAPLAKADGLREAELWRRLLPRGVQEAELQHQPWKPLGLQEAELQLQPWVPLGRPEAELQPPPWVPLGWQAKKLEAALLCQSLVFFSLWCP
jgi:hypothetical protein